MSILGWHHVRIIAAPTADAVSGAALALSALHSRAVASSVLIGSRAPRERHTHYLLIGEVDEPPAQEIIKVGGKEDVASLLGIDAIGGDTALVEACLARGEPGVALCCCLGDDEARSQAREHTRLLNAQIAKAKAHALTHPTYRSDGHLIAELGARLPCSHSPQLAEDIASERDCLAVVVCRADVGRSRITIRGKNADRLDHPIDTTVASAAVPDLLEDLHRAIEKSALEETV